MHRCIVSLQGSPLSNPVVSFSRVQFPIARHSRHVFVTDTMFFLGAGECLKCHPPTSSRWECIKLPPSSWSCLRLGRSNAFWSIFGFPLQGTAWTAEILAGKDVKWPQLDSCDLPCLFQLSPAPGLHRKAPDMSQCVPLLRTPGLGFSRAISCKANCHNPDRGSHITSLKHPNKRTQNPAPQRAPRATPFHFSLKFCLSALPI